MAVALNELLFIDSFRGVEGSVGVIPLLVLVRLVFEETLRQMRRYYGTLGNERERSAAQRIRTFTANPNMIKYSPSPDMSLHLVQVVF